jgi:hypothetical protein
MASNHQLSDALRDNTTASRVVSSAIVANREAAMLTRRQTDLANRGKSNEQTLLNASAATYFAAIDPSAVISY